MRQMAFLATRLVFGSAANRRKLLPIVIGMAMAIIPLIVIQHAAVGIISGIAARYIETDSFHFRAESQIPLNIRELEEMQQQMENIEGIESVHREWVSPGILMSQTRRQPVSIRAIESDLWQKDKEFSRYMTILQGSADLSRADQILLGSGIAEALGAEVGDAVELLTVNIWQEMVLPRVSTFQVGGIVSSGYRDLDRLWVFIPLALAPKVLPPDGSRQFLKMKVTDPYAIPNDLLPQFLPRPRQTTRVMQDLMRVLSGKLSYGWTIRTWYELGIRQFDRFRSTRQLMLLLMLLILCVGSVIVSVFLSRLIVEQEYSLSMLRALGASSTLIFRILLAIGSIIGLVASMGGITLALLILLSINKIIAAIDWLVNTIAALSSRILGISLPRVALLSSELYLEEIPIDIQFFPLIVVAVGAVIVSTIAALLPARASLRIHPSGIILRGL